MYIYVYMSPCIYVAYLALAAAPLALDEGGHFIFWSISDAASVTVTLKIVKFDLTGSDAVTRSAGSEPTKKNMHTTSQETG